MPVILKVMIIAASRFSAATECVFNNPHFHPDGHFIGRGICFSPLLQGQEKASAAVEHLTEAKRIYRNLDNPDTCAVETALAE